MKFEDALKIEGAQSVGGQLIVRHNGRNVVVGKQVQGTLIVAETEEAKAIIAEVTTVATAEIEVDSTGEKMPEPTQLPAAEPTPPPSPVPKQRK